ncbi:caspase family protein [Hymenobacter fodinae]|uniref:Caspase family protein n=1 Tax=Hymenobacter fodinae TaxID=2510796 RepID=A0A4Z0P0D1_9BACT|nr:caspase family protein [Hymenobacter fodinae]TGE03843.1 caspase family protein [Hymenobacter fodinae]
MAQAYSLHLGLNYVDPTHYVTSAGQGWNGELYGCENDARDLAALARQQGFAQSEIALTQEVTADFVDSSLRRFADLMKPDDLFLLTYSGHGGQLTDFNDDEAQDEKDGLDETWCLYDRQMSDDELYMLWAHFPLGSRLLVLSDSCHSGSVVKNSFYGTSTTDNRTAEGKRYRFMPRSTRVGTNQKNKEQYEANDKKVTAEAEEQGRVKACVRLISGCQSDQLSQDLDDNGLFTMQLKNVWADGQFQGPYSKFVQAIKRRMPEEQQPNHMTVGARNAAYGRQRPFTV